MHDRLRLLLKTKNISASKFADEIGVQRSSISHIFSGRNKPSFDFIQKILSRYPEISSDWLISGKGPMTHAPDLFTEQSGQYPKTTPPIQDEPSAPVEKTKISDEFYEYKKIPPAGKSEKIQVPVEEKEALNKSVSQVSKPKEKMQSAQNKKVTKIIILYSDKSFTEYYPDNE